MRELRIFLGGSYDPVHIAHERVATHVSALLNQPVYFLPTSQSPFKNSGSVSDEHRLNMLRLVANGSSIAIETYEMQQAGVHYTVDTVRHFLAKAILPVFIVGWDAFASVGRWRESAYIRTQAAWIVVPRPTADLALDEVLHPWWQSRRVLAPEFLTEIKGGDLFECAMPLQNVSSTQVRAQLRQQSVPEASLALEHDNNTGKVDHLQSLLNPSVLAYIQEHRLYQ